MNDAQAWLRSSGMRLGVLYTTDVYNSIYRAVLPAEALRKKGHDVRLIRHDDMTRVPMEHFADREVVHVFRRHDKVAAKFVDQLRARLVPPLEVFGKPLEDRP